MSSRYFNLFLNSSSSFETTEFRGDGKETAESLFLLHAPPTAVDVIDGVALRPTPPYNNKRGGLILIGRDRIDVDVHPAPRAHETTGVFIDVMFVFV